MRHGIMQNAAQRHANACDCLLQPPEFGANITAITVKDRNLRAYALCLFLALLPTSTLASDIVALGASNTLGRGKGAGHGGVERSQAYPAQLQSMLSQQGCKVRVVNAGVAGDTPAGMAARLPKLLTRQTRVVILQPGGNDSGPDRANAIAQIERTLSDRKIALVMLDRPGQLARAYQLPDGLHFSAEGHAAFASFLLPKVVAAGACS
jgi:acyl-CoA thioesterase-1